MVAHPEYNAVTIWRKDPCETTDITVYLAPFDPANQRRQRRPMCVIWTSARQVMGDDVRTFLCDMVSTYPVAHGFVGSFRSRAFAGREVFQSMDSVSEIDASTDARLHEDAMLDYLTNDRLRRLYPVTLIGPAIWAQLPPMPACDPAPTVEDLGDCKLLTVWPTLCEPRDPAFLRGTRALREWLWPFTIQNPADHVDNDPVG
ncbi:MAG: hypothetical protein IPL61_34015 [Myxococcales bacterium]|nr:hypothetical protein [Myxococcales bacterium]